MTGMDYAAWDQNTRRFYILAGSPWHSSPEIRVFDLASAVWTRLDPRGETPAGRSGSSLVCDSKSGVLYLFGGNDSRRDLNDLWVYSFQRNNWERDALQGPRPRARSGHSLVCDPAAGDLYLFGGSFGENYISRPLRDLWRYSPDSNSWQELKSTGAPPPALFEHRAVWDEHTGTMLVFGGIDSEGCSHEFWAYHAVGKNWMNMSPSAPPPPRALHSAAWDPFTRKLYIFGGTFFGGTAPHIPALNDLWVYTDGSRPTNIAGLPLPRTAVNQGRACSYCGQTITPTILAGRSYCPQCGHIL
jgi:hypothetical protein